MKYSPKIYARALVDVILRTQEEHKKNELAGKFLEMLKKRGDLKQLKKIIFESERLLQKKTGLRKIIIEFARPLRTSKMDFLGHIVKKGDMIEERINPELVAGIKIILNGDMQFDGSLKRKLDLLFK